MNALPTADAIARIKIQVAIPSRNLVGHDLCGGLAVALSQMKQDLHYDVTVKIWPGFGVDIVRNQIVADFLTTDAQFLLMIDDDMIPPPGLLDMAGHNCDIVGALYYAWDTSVGLFIAAYDRDSAGRYRRPGEPGEVENTGLREVALLGGGCLLFHRRVLETIPAPWFVFETDAGGQHVVMPEDFHICEAARRHGFKIFLDTDRVCGHIKSLDLRDVNALLSPQRQNSSLIDLLK